MFRDFKKGGYNLEDTNISGEQVNYFNFINSVSEAAPFGVSPTLVPPSLDNKLNVKVSKNLLVVLKNMDVKLGGIAVFILAYMVKLG